MHSMYRIFSPGIVLHNKFAMHVLCAQHQVLWKIKIQLNMAHGFQKFTISISELQSEILNYNLSPVDKMNSCENHILCH